MKWQRIKYHPNTPLGKDGRKVTACQEHIELSKNVAKEGMVLLKNERQLLPLKKGSTIALFGKGTFDYVKGGGGSGEVTVPYMRNLYEGFKQLDGYVHVYEELADFYRQEVEKQYGERIAPGMVEEPELSDQLCKKARNYADIAVISISRFSSEEWDRKSNYDEEVIPGDEHIPERAKEIFPDGDFYLTKAEKAMVDKVKSYFSNIVVVLNVGGMVDSEWFAKDSGITSVLAAWQGGMEGGTAAAELICGMGNPSGKLSDTFAKRLEDYPSTYNFHESMEYVEYTEDIYVGYRYFETIPGAQEKVNYPFGFGMSYTEFEWSILSMNEQEGRIKVQVQVLNIGNMAGKEVIQIYVNAPQGKLGKANKSLVAFRKTDLLQPGEMRVVCLDFAVNDMASYDDLGKIKKSAYILEEGDYRFYVGTSVRDVKISDYVYTVKKDRIVKQYNAKLAPTALTKRMLSDGSFEDMTRACVLKKEKTAITETCKEEKKLIPSTEQWTLSDVADGKTDVDTFIQQFADEELAKMLGGQPNVGVANTWGIGNVPQHGVPNVMTADGPAGLRIQPECGVYTTGFPCSMLLACTWNPDLAREVGENGALEVKENNLGMWLTPAVNIHRSPLCGRNFEYYSEDPYLAGKMAAAMVCGIQSQHVSSALKHFAFNNKETNRRNSDSRVSERAAREIYLKVFEIVVKEAQPWCVMSSYNLVNGERTSECTDLLTGILREEWGYTGMVTSDWFNIGEHWKEVKAGNDLKMPFGDTESLLRAKQNGLITRQDMENSGRRILNMILKLSS